MAVRSARTCCPKAARSFKISLAFLLQWMQFSQHSEAIPFYHGHSNPIGRAVEIPHISIYMSGLYPPYLPGETHRHISEWREGHKIASLRNAREPIDQLLKSLL
ncbi:uncharacterized protein LOC117181110 [Belonocnema kinseyi]|uniref:uncharacterized protein LOC117181110 n=1 Tax=Belonocnema kinseyi TaxID=2817044 RepID=UPI00143D8DCA|nr:uncharacterized protein LOC117181110 [Belonocnema kinseyi]